MAFEAALKINFSMPLSGPLSEKSLYRDRWKNITVPVIYGILKRTCRVIEKFTFGTLEKTEIQKAIKNWNERNLKAGETITGRKGIVLKKFKVKIWLWPKRAPAIPNRLRSRSKNSLPPGDNSRPKKRDDQVYGLKRMPLP